MNVARINAHITTLHCPDELRSLQGWVIWRSEQGDGSKPRKVPYYAAGGKRHGVQGRPEDRAQLVTFDAACAAAARRGFDGVGLCLMPEFGIVVVDFDDVVTSRGLHPDVAELVSTTYAEYSPGGSGAHAMYIGELGDRKSHADGTRFGVETFSTKGFVTFTGNALPHVADLELAGPVIAPVTEPLRQLCAERFGRKRDPLDDDPLLTNTPPIGLTASQLQECLDVLDASMGHDAWLQVGMALHHETQGERFDLWDDWSSLAEEAYPGREALAKRWESFGKADGRKVTARTLVKMANAAGARVSLNAVLTDIDFDDVTPASGGAPASQRGRFAPMSLGELMAQTRARWLVKRLLPETGVGIVFGPSMAGKSFLLLDLCLAIVQGQPWRGRKTRAGGVAYILAEGASGFPDRLRAYMGYHGVDGFEGLPLHVIPAAPNLLEKQDVRELMVELKALPELRLVIVDTIAQTTPGADENSSQDMGRALAHAQAIARATKVLVLLVGHTGKDESKGLRGWSGMLAAFDVALQLERDGELRQATVVKQKDGPGEGDAYPFRLMPVTLGQDEDGEDITSCVALEGSVRGGAAPRIVRPRGPKQAVLLNTLTELMDLAGPPTTMQLLDAARDRLPHSEGEKDRRRADVTRALEALVAANAVRITDSGVVEFV